MKQMQEGSERVCKGNKGDTARERERKIQNDKKKEGRYVKRFIEKEQNK